MSRSLLFHKSTGISLVQYINKIRIGQAKKYLLSTDWTITEIAFKVGFNSLPHFNRIFKEFESCCSSKFRKNNERKYINNSIRIL